MNTYIHQPILLTPILANSSLSKFTNQQQLESNYQNFSNNSFSPSTSSTIASSFSLLENISPKQFFNNLMIRIALNQLNELMASENALEQAKLTEKTAIQMAIAKERQQQQQQRHSMEVEQKTPALEKFLRSSSTNFNSNQIFQITKGREDEEQAEKDEEEPYLTRCGITWKFLKTVKNDQEFDEFRRGHQVSKNRHVGYGTRYACTRNAKARDNCPYLMLCIQGSNGKLKVFYRNQHTHPIRHIRTRE